MSSLCGRVVAMAMGACGFALSSSAAIVFTPVYNPSNGHYYAQISAIDAGHNDGITWDQAYAIAESLTFMGLKGHLATITSQNETDWVVANMQQACIDLYYLGGRQTPGLSDPEAGWSWVTGEVWNYTNWETIEPEPNDGRGHVDEIILSLWRYDYRAPYNPNSGYPLGVWNDEPLTYVEDGITYTHTSKGFLVEFEAPIPAPGSLALAAFGSFVMLRRQR